MNGMGFTEERHGVFYERWMLAAAWRWMYRVLAVSAAGVMLTLVFATLAQAAPAGGEFQVNTTDSDFQGSQSVAMDSDGDFVVTWQSDGQDGSDNGIYGQRYDVDTTAPTVSSVTPTKMTGVSRVRGNIKATFSEPVDKATVEALDPTTQESVNVKLINTATGNQVAATVSCNADPCNKVKITPNRTLAANTKYRAIVTTRVKDLAGNRLDQDPTTTGNQREVWTFTTRR